MKTRMQHHTLAAFAGVTGLALLGLAAPGTAHAEIDGPLISQLLQTKTPRQPRPAMKPKSDMQKMDKSDMQMGEDRDDYEYADAAPINYPMAAPGSLHLYHYRTYRGNTIAEGNINDVRMDKQKMMDKKNMMMSDDMMMRNYLRRSYYDDPFHADPAPVNYPIAAPGSLHLYSYTDYTMNKMMEGSATDKRMDNQKMMDKKNMMMGSDTMMRDYLRRSYYDDPFHADPAPVNYPIAAPGSLHLYSYTDYTMTKMTEGSATDKRMDQQKMMDKKTMDSGKKMKKSK